MLLHTQILAFLILIFHHVNGQSNYASHANNINYIGEGLPEETVLDGKVSDFSFCGHWTLSYTLNCQFPRHVLHTLMTYVGSCAKLKELTFLWNSVGGHFWDFLRLYVKF